MARYPKSGATDTALDSTYVYDLVGSAVTTSRVFLLRSFWAYNSATADSTISLYNAPDSTGITAGDKRFSIYVPFERSVMVDFPEDGLKFIDGCCAAKDATAGTFAIGAVGGAGFEE